MTTRLEFPGGELEVLDIPGADAASPLLLLHGGLGSVGLWDQFPYRLSAATGRRTVAFSRHGHGYSAPPRKPRTTRFMHEEARDVVPELIARLELQDPVLVGHSDGASIALIYAASHRVPALIAIAPHVFVETVCVEEISRARQQYVEGDLRSKMEPHHGNPNAAFFGWSEVWLDPDFRAWDIRDLLTRVTAPLLLIQGEDDQYGTLAQLDEIERLAPGPVQRLHLNCRHAPFIQRPQQTVAAITRFLSRLGERAGVVREASGAV